MTTWNTSLLNETVDISREFTNMQSTFYAASKLTAFDPKKASGLLEWRRYEARKDVQFNQSSVDWIRVKANEFPSGVYPETPLLPLSIEFVTAATVRIRISLTTATGEKKQVDGDSLMLNGPVPHTGAWHTVEDDGKTVYSSEKGRVIVRYDPFGLEFRDAAGHLLTRTKQIDERWSFQNNNPIPFSFVRRADSLARHLAATFTLSPDEKLFGCGESFTRLNKRGQKIILWARDAKGCQGLDMYKPIPFFLSSRGYAMFVHTSAPLTFDLGHTYDGANTIFVGADELDLFFFFGPPQDVLTEYTALTGRSPVPPLWSFGLWMSRITYKSEEEVREVARELREREIPCDVIHLDTGWFETDWCCDFEFSRRRFPVPEQMIRDLREMGFRISLWQLPYFTPANPLYREAIARGYVVRDSDGHLPTEDAIIDFSNPEAVAWYQAFLARLLKMGVGAIKVDFGEGAPLHGQYASGRSGFYEHNLYPLRYNRAAAEITRQITGESIIWARSAWAGSQRYPLHWGGDAENTDSAMAATLRAGLSLGLCGFTFWSHDIGGFVKQAPPELYRRWLPFGLLTSHSRCHGAPPREPWHYGEEFTREFRRAVTLRYRLIPYIYAQAKLCAERGHPLLQTLFFQYPDDPGSWLVEDEYFFGSDLLVAPLFESEANERLVYLPPGKWIDYQTGKTYAGGRWEKLTAGEIPIIILVKDGAVIPHVAPAQSTAYIDWSNIELRFFRVDANRGDALILLPDRQVPERITVVCENGTTRIVADPLAGQVNWGLTCIPSGFPEAARQTVGTQVTNENK